MEAVAFEFTLVISLMLVMSLVETLMRSSTVVLAPIWNSIDVAPEPRMDLPLNLVQCRNSNDRCLGLSGAFLDAIAGANFENRGMALELQILPDV